jgi:hypothetical protein
MDTIGHQLEDLLDRMRCHANGVMDRAMMFDERLDPLGEREDPTFELTSIEVEKQSKYGEDLHAPPGYRCVSITARFS